MIKLILTIWAFSTINVFARGVDDLKLVGKTFITNRPLMYVINQTWYYGDNRDAKLGTSRYLKYNRVLKELRNSCSGCLNRDGLVTPIRIEYVPPGTKLLVKGIFRYKTMGLGSMINFFSIEDSNGILSETMATGFNPEYKHLNEEERNSISAASLYNESKTVVITTCNLRDKKVIELLVKDFSLNKDILSYKSESAFSGNICTDFKFKNLTAYLTYRYFYDEWKSEVKGAESIYDDSKCVETLNDENRGSYICSSTSKKIFNSQKQDKIERLLNGWRISNHQLMSIEHNNYFKNWNSKLQLLVIENIPNREVLVSMCKSHKSLSAKLNCYLENSSCKEFSGLRDYNDCIKNRKK